MNRHEGVSCDSCLKNNFRGRRYKCLTCIDYDLCAACYESGTTTNKHTAEHPMQCILAGSDFDLYYGGENLALEQPQAFTCPFCSRMGFTDTTLMEHVTSEHADSTLAVVCPVCASMPGGEPNYVTVDFAEHLTLEHRNGPRDLISFLDEPSSIRHGGVRRLPHSGRGVNRPRRTNMQFINGGVGGISSLSPSSRDAVVEPIAELLSQLGIRRQGQPGTSSQLQQLQVQMQIDRGAATGRSAAERVRGRGATTSTAAPPAAAPAHTAPTAQHQENYLLTPFLGGTSPSESVVVSGVGALARGVVLASLGPRPPLIPVPPPLPQPPFTHTARKTTPRHKDVAARAQPTARQLPESK